MDEWLDFDQPGPGILQQLRRQPPVGLALLALAAIALAVVIEIQGRTSTDQGVNTLAAGPTAPFIGFDPSLAYDVARRQVVLVNNPGETWLWANRTWTRAQPAISPPAGCCNVAAWDPEIGRVLLFGVEPPGDAAQFTYTYAWNGATWTALLRGAVEPPPGAASMAYDPGHRQMVLLVGFGTAAGAVRVQTWTFEGERWLRRTDLDSPTVSFITALGFDAAAHALLAVSSNVADAGTQTWRWDGAAWHRLTPSHDPPGSAHMTLVNEPGSGRPLLLTEADAATSRSAISETWIWDGGDWVEHGPPGARDVIPYAVSAASDGIHGTLWAFQQFPPDADTVRSVEALQWSGTGWERAALTRVARAP